MLKWVIDRRNNNLHKGGVWLILLKLGNAIFYTIWKENQLLGNRTKQVGQGQIPNIAELKWIEETNTNIKTGAKPILDAKVFLCTKT